MAMKMKLKNIGKKNMYKIIYIKNIYGEYIKFISTRAKYNKNLLPFKQ